MKDFSAFSSLLTANPRPIALGMAFRQTVIGHPSVQAYRSALIVEDEKWFDVFETGCFPSWAGHHLWPVVTTGEALAEAAVRPDQFEMLAALNQGLPLPKPKPSNELSEACRVIADRLIAFFEYLARGEVDAVDIYGLKPGSAAWSRPGAMIDVQTSDYYLDYRQIPFRGLSLEANGRSAAVLRPPSVSDSPQSDRPGREPSYDYQQLRENLRGHCAIHGRFEDSGEFVRWCIRNTPLLPGRERPKGAGKHPDRKTVLAAIEKYGLDRIGLADGVTLEKGKSVSPAKPKKISQRRNRR